MSLTRNGFQDFVNAQPAPAEAGDFAGANPRMTVRAGAGGFVAEINGVVVGRFAWGNPATGVASNANSANTLLGFVHRENQAIIVPFLQSYVLTILAGLNVSLYSRGDFWAEFTAGAAIGASVYTDPVTGQASTSSGGGNILTPWFVATTVEVDASVTASIDGNGIMTVTAIGSGVLEKGQYLSGTGVPNNTIIESQLTGTAGSTGTYRVNTLIPVTSTAITATVGKLGKISTWQNM